MYITPFYTALLGLGFVTLSVLTLRLRRKFQIPLGDGGNKRLLRAIRVHSNFAEYVPLSVILIFMAELQNAPSFLIHLLGSCLLIGRLSHAWGVSQNIENYKFRVFGMAMTFTTLVTSSIYLIFSYISTL
jgi:uncharacterized membrane protein YecN with MAPEG domain